MQVHDSQLKIYKLETNLIASSGLVISDLFGYKCSGTRCSTDFAAGFLKSLSFFHCCVMWCWWKHLHLVTVFRARWHKIYHVHVELGGWGGVQYFFSRFLWILFWLVELGILSPAASTQKLWIVLHSQGIISLNTLCLFLLTVLSL